MRLQHITIENMAGITQLDWDLPAVGLITGGNGEGKSSFIRVINYAFGRRPDGTTSISHSPAMLHGNATDGKATITFDDGSKLMVTITQKKGTARYIMPKGGDKWLKATEEINALANAIGYDPMLFRTFDTTKRIETLLRLNPDATATKEELIAAIEGSGIPAARYFIKGAERIPLEILGNAYADIYEARKEVNAAGRQSEAHAKELEAALPPATLGGSWKEQAETLRLAKEDLERGMAAFRDEVGRELQAAKDRLARKLADDIRALEENNAKELEAARATANLKVAAKQADVAPRRDELIAKIAEAEQNMALTAQAEGSRLAAARASEAATAKRKESNLMTGALEKLADLKRTVAGRLKIKGITIAAPKEGLPVDICRQEGDALVPFSVWNETSQILFCLKIAVLAHGQCGLVCVDSIDGVKGVNLERMIAACKTFAEKEGLQFLLGTATDGPLAVKEV